MASMTVTPGWVDPPASEPMVVRPRTIVHLDLADPKFGGLKISCRSQSFAEWTDDKKVIEWPGPDAGSEALNGYFRAVAARFAENIIEWNLTDTMGGAEPISAEALMGLDRSVVMSLINAWTDAISGKVEPPLDDGSPSGKPSVEASIPMEPLSGSLAS